MIDFYRPVRNSSCGKAMFLQASVILSMGEGGSGRHPPGRHTPGQTHPLGRHPPWADTSPPNPGDGHCSGRYASYWNALLSLVSLTSDTTILLVARQRVAFLIESAFCSTLCKVSTGTSRKMILFGAPQSRSFITFPQQ